MDRFADILATCLNDIEQGRATVETCLQRYPEHAPELRPLLQTALAVRRVPAVEPSPAFQAAAPTRMANLLAARSRVAPPSTKEQTWRWQPVLVKVVVAVVLACLCLGGTAYAARDSMPTSPLYPVKRTVEQVQVITALNDLRRARLFINQMDQRALETAAMIRAGRWERSVETMRLYARGLRDAEAALERVPANRPEGRLTLLYTRERLLAQQAILQRAQATSSEPTRSVVRPLLLGIQRLVDRIDRRLESAPQSL